MYYIFLKQKNTILLWSKKYVYTYLNGRCVIFISCLNDVTIFMNYKAKVVLCNNKNIIIIWFNFINCNVIVLFKFVKKKIYNL